MHRCPLTRSQSRPSRGAKQNRDGGPYPSRLARTIFTFGMLALFAVESASAAVSAESLLSRGKQLYVYQSEQTGHAVMAIGMTASQGDPNVAMEIARTDAYRKLAAFISGQQVASLTEYNLRSDGVDTVRSFFSQRSVKVSATIRAAQEQASGRYQGRHYVALLLTENGIDVASHFKQQLDGNTLMATGIASLQGGIEKARQLALDSALRNAVAMYNGVGAAGQSTVVNATQLRSKMATRTNGVVSRYRITREESVDGSYRVEIVATIEESITDPSQISQAVRENLGRPATFIDTENALARQALSELLIKEGFDVTGRPEGARFVLDVTTSFDERPALADMLGRQTTLQVQLQDTMSSDPAIHIANDPAQSLEVSDNARIRASRSMRYAVESIQDTLVQQMSTEFVEQFNNGAKVEVTFHNFGKMRFVESMQALLDSFPLTKSVSLRPVSSGVARFDVLYLGDPSELQLMAVKNAHKYRLMGLKAKNQQGGGLQFTF